LNNQDADDTLELVAGKRNRTWGGRRDGAGRKREVRDPRRLTIDLESPDYAALETIASEADRSVASVVREAVAEYLRRSPGSKR
jgi:hypothetical protein